MEDAKSRTDSEVLAYGKSRKEWYREVYLQSEHWLSLRGKALAQHGAKCFTCGTSKHLDVHHLNYRNIYDVEIGDLQVLCRAHHDAEHPEFQKRAPKSNLDKFRKREFKKLRKSKRKADRVGRKWIPKRSDVILLSKGNLKLIPWTTANLAFFGLSRPLKPGWMKPLRKRTISRSGFEMLLERKYVP